MGLWSVGHTVCGCKVIHQKRNVPFAEGFARFVRLVDSHVTLAVVAVMVALGGWVPLLINPQSSHSIAAHQLPEAYKRNPAGSYGWAVYYHTSDVKNVAA